MRVPVLSVTIQPIFQYVRTSGMRYSTSSFLQPIHFEKYPEPWATRTRHHIYSFCFLQTAFHTMTFEYTCVLQIPVVSVTKNKHDPNFGYLDKDSLIVLLFMQTKYFIENCRFTWKVIKIATFNKTNKIWTQHILHMTIMKSEQMESRPGTFKPSFFRIKKKCIIIQGNIISLMAPVFGMCPQSLPHIFLYDQKKSLYCR